MCGIVGCIGESDVVEPVLAGLEALEYRGYDSAGITVTTEKSTSITLKQVGRVEYLKKDVSSQPLIQDGVIAIGHTRWATHGIPSTENAHPHTNKTENIHVVHNGIIENYQELKQFLETKGYAFYSQTDTEVIPKLIDYHLQKNVMFLDAFEKAISELSGAYAIAATYDELPDKLYVARLSSPLVIGIDKDKHYVASDPSAISKYTNKVIYLDDYDVSEITKDSIKTRNIKKDGAVEHIPQELDFSTEEALLGDFPHFMLKEIHDAPVTVQSATRGRIKPDSNIVKLGGLESVEQQLKFIDRIVIVACGTSYYAGLIGEYLIEEIAGIPVEVQLASEFKYRNEPFSRSTALIAVSQSGETADTIAAIKKVEPYGVLKLGVVNAVGSTIARITDAGVYCHAGPEQSVASTKAFIAQVTVLTEIALFLSQTRTPLFKPLLTELLNLPDKITEVLAQDSKIKKIAEKFKNSRDFLYIGRGYAFPCALEGALKLKEISYIHAEGYAAGEMKHGPLAMIDDSFPTFAIAWDSPLLEKTVSNIQEIKARSGPVVAIITEGNNSVRKLTNDVIEIPATMEQTQPILAAIALQLFSYHVAVAKGLNVDRPRNLAKSVTVE